LRFPSVTFKREAVRFLLGNKGAGATANMLDMLTNAFTRDNAFFNKIVAYLTLQGLPCISGLTFIRVSPLFKYAHFGNPALNRASDLLLQGNAIPDFEPE
jgi:hypothetical protein